MRAHVVILHIKMGSPKRRIDIYLRLQRLFCFIDKFSRNFRVKLYSQVLIPTRVLKSNIPISSLPHIYDIFDFTPRVFGCACFIHNLGLQIHKLDTRTIKGIFLGYSPTHNGYKCYVPFPGKWYITKDIIFLEKNFYNFRHTPHSGGGSDEKYY